MTVETKTQNIPSLEFDRVAVHEDGRLQFVSLLADGVRLKAVRAMLSGATGKATITASGMKLVKPGYYGEKSIGNMRISNEPAGYDCHIHKLGMNLAQCMMISRAEGFMVNVTETALWNQIKDTRFTTPVLRDWLPYIKRELERRGLLNWCWIHDCKCATLTANVEHLDDIVKKGLNRREIEIADPNIIDTTLADPLALEDHRGIQGQSPSVQ